MNTRTKLGISGQIAFTLIICLTPFVNLETWFYASHLKANAALSRLFTSAEKRPAQTLLLETDPADFHDSNRLRQIRQQLITAGARAVWTINAFEEISSQVSPDGIFRFVHINPPQENAQPSSLRLFLEMLGANGPELQSTDPITVAWRTRASALNPVCRWSLTLKKCGDLRDRAVVVIPFQDRFADVITPQGPLSQPQIFAQIVDAVRAQRTLHWSSWLTRIFVFALFSVLLTLTQAPAIFPVLGFIAFVFLPQIFLGFFHAYLPIAGAAFAFMLQLSYLGYRNERDKTLTRNKFDFILSLSHELKTPLARLFLGIDRGKPELITRSAHELKEQIDSLLRLAKLESMELSPQLEACSLDQVLRDTLQSYRLLLEQKNIRMQINSGVVYNLLSDPRILQLIFSNLISNTYRHAPQGSTVAISTVEKTEGIVIQWSSPGISDSYQIPPKPAPGSSGSGIYICVRLTESLGGKLRFDATGEIPAFIITLPIASNLAKRSAKLFSHS